MMAGKWLNQRQVTKEVTLYKCLSSSFDFYYMGSVNYSNPTAATINKMQTKDSLLLFSSLKDLKDINTDSVNLSVLKSFPYFKVSQVTGKFIHRKTRKEVVDTMAIALITRKN